jgi:hypothetical protein
MDKQEEVLKERDNQLEVLLCPPPPPDCGPALDQELLPQSAFIKHAV